MATINEVAEVDLEIHENADLAFDFEWWQDEAETIAVVLTGGEGVVRGGGETHALAPFVTVLANRASVFVPERRSTHGRYSTLERGSSPSFRQRKRRRFAEARLGTSGLQDEHVQCRWSGYPSAGDV